jgi:F-type H+-transporting ATPase subunit epsilon
MKSFRLALRDTAKHEYIDNVVSFVGEDDSGSFGILANHTRFITQLAFGLARFKVAGSNWQYLAMPGAMLYFVNNELSLITRRYLKSDNYDDISQALIAILSAEEQGLQEMKLSLHRIEEYMVRYMLEHEIRTTPS